MSFSQKALAEISDVQYVTLGDNIRQSAKNYYRRFIGLPMVIVAEPLTDCGRETHPALCIYPFDKDKHIRVHDSVSRFLRFHDRFTYILHTPYSMERHAKSFDVYMLYGKGVGTVAIPRELLTYMSSNSISKHTLERL